MDAITLLIIYFAAVNLISFAMMGFDKRRAQKHLFRIPESTLFVLAAIGGSIGSIAGMQFFRHKTRKWYFVYGMPVILAVQLILMLTLFFLPVELTIL